MTSMWVGPISVAGSLTLQWLVAPVHFRRNWVRTAVISPSKLGCFPQLLRVDFGWIAF